MVKRWTVRGACAAVGAIVTLLPVTAGAQAAKAGLDNACVVTETKQTSEPRRGMGGILARGRNAVKSGVDAARELARKGDELGLDLNVGVGGGPICRARTQEQLLLLTGLVMDRAALSAAKGVDAAQEALGRQRTLLTKIADLQRAVDGLGSGNSTDTEVIIRQVSTESSGLTDEITRLKENNSLDEKARLKLAEAQRNLNEVSYFGISAGAGASLFAEFMKSGETTAKVIAMLMSPSIGIGSEFIKAVPARLLKIEDTVRNARKLNGTISEVVAPEPPAEGQKRARKLAEDDAERILKAMTATGLGTTPRLIAN